MRSSALIGIVSLASLVLGCESRVSLGGQCASASECSALLTCVGGVCREECRGPNECPSGQRCIAGPSGVRACSRPEEETCSSTDPCNPDVFTECRAGQCVTGCAAGDDCVSGSCDTTSGSGVCVEPVSTGGLDAGAIDGGGPTCLPAPASSPRTLEEAIFGVGTTADRTESAYWVEELGAAALSLADTNVSLAVGVRAGGADGPRVLTVVNLGPHEAGEVELSIHRSSPFAAPDFAIARSGQLAAAIQFGAMAAVSTPDTTTIALLRPNPTSPSDVFTWLLPETGDLVNLEPGGAPSSFPGDVAMLTGPDEDFARELLALDEITSTGVHRIALIGTPYGMGNSTSVALPAEWGDDPLTMSATHGTILLHQAASGRSILARCPGAEMATSRPLLTLDELTGLETDTAPALLDTTSPTSFRVVTSDAACGVLPIVDVACAGPDCTASAPSRALEISGAMHLESEMWGQASVVLTRTSAGATLTFLDADGTLIASSGFERASLPPTESVGLDTLSLADVHVAASVSGDDAVLALAGLYVDGAGGGRLRLLALGFRRL